MSHDLHGHEPGDEVHLPSPSMWPFVAAGGVTLLLFGVVSSLAFSLVGFLLLAVGLGGWMGDVRRG